jgi:hypothetical protein
MAAGVDHTFGGRLRWIIEAMSLWTEMQQEKLFKELSAALPDLDDKERAELNNFCGWYVLVDDIEFMFDDKEKAALKKFRDNWKKRETMTPRELLNFWLKLPYAIRGAWVTAVNAEQDMFDVDPAQLPDEALTGEQKAEAATPGSPLI